MTETYKIYGTNRGTAVGEGIELSRTSTTRRFLLWERIESKLKVTLVHQRKSSRNVWENEPSTPMTLLKAGEAKKFILSFEETEQLRHHLQNLFEIVEQARVNPGFSHLVVAPENEVVVTSRNRAKIIKALLAKGYSDDLWKALVQADPDLATELSYARIHGERLRGLEEFERNLALNQSEGWWQSFFSRNDWIFGYGLNYKFLTSVQEQPSYGGAKLSGKGMQQGDFLRRTEAFIRFTVLVEIKKPDTNLFGSTQYRNGAWELHQELIGGVTQVQSNCSKWEKEGAQSDNNREALLKEQTFTVQPKGILVIGHTKQLSEISKRNSFELFRRNTVNPEIITFDELFERARFIVERTATRNVVERNGD
jgi:hypothetical protein